MKVQFYLRFYSHPGQELFICGDVESLGNNDPSKALSMKYLNNDFWQATLEIDASQAAKIQYHYLLKYDNGIVIAEWGKDRLIDISKSGIEEVQVIDTWNHAGELDNAFFTAPFQQTLLAPHKASVKPKATKLFTHIFKVKAPLLKKDETICLCGSGKTLRDWDTKSPHILTPEGNWWVIKLNLPKESFPLFYKYGVYDTKKKTFVRFE